MCFEIWMNRNLKHVSLENVKNENTIMFKQIWHEYQANLLIDSFENIKNEHL